MDLKRKVTSVRGDIVIDDTYEIKKDVLYAKEAGTPEFIKVRDQMRKCFSKKLLVLK